MKSLQQRKISLFLLSIILSATLIMGIYFIAEIWKTCGEPYEQISFSHPLGTNFSGEDTLGRLLLALKGSLINSFFLTFLCCFFASFLAFSLNMLKRNPLRKTVFFLSNILDTVPPYLLIFCYYASFRASPYKLNILILAIFWPLPFKSLSNQIKVLMKNETTLAAKQLGCSRFRIFKHYLLPPMELPILAEANLLFLSLLKLEISLSFIGIYSGTINLGTLFAEASEDLLRGEYINLFSVTCALAILLSFLSMFKKRLETHRT